MVARLHDRILGGDAMITVLALFIICTAIVCIFGYRAHRDQDTARRNAGNVVEPVDERKYAEWELL